MRAIQAIIANSARGWPCEAKLPHTPGCLGCLGCLGIFEKRNFVGAKMGFGDFRFSFFEKSLDSLDSLDRIGRVRAIQTITANSVRGWACEAK